MIDKLKTLFNIIWIKMRYPKVKTSGVHHINLRTEIVLRSGGQITLGKRVSTQRRVTLSTVRGSLIVGNDTSFNRNDIIVCREQITIGNHCLFGPNVCIYDHDHRFNSEGIKAGFKTSPIIIEDNCWIGANVTILRGTHIGEGSVIGSGVVVKGNIPSHSLVTNNRELIIRPIER